MAKHNRCVELLDEAKFTFLSSSEKVYKHHRALPPHVTNDHAVTFQRPVSSLPGVLVIEEEVQ